MKSQAVFLKVNKRQQRQAQPQEQLLVGLLYLELVVVLERLQMVKMTQVVHKTNYHLALSLFTMLTSLANKTGFQANTLNLDKTTLLSIPAEIFEVWI